MLTDLLVPLFPLVFLLYVIYEHFRSPLRCIPSAHPTAPFSRLWILSRTLTNQRNRSIHAAHLKYGPIVRLGPSEISINDPALVKSVYSAGGGFDKPPWYHIFTNYGSQPLFALLHIRSHAQRKKMLSNIYSNSFISTSPALAKTTRDLLETRLVPLLLSKETHEALELYNALAMDFVTAHLLTQHHSTHFIENESERRRFLDWYQSRRRYFVWSSELPGLVRFIEKATFGCFRVVPSWVNDVNGEIEDWCMRLCTACEEDMTKDKVQEGDCVYYRLRKNGALSKTEAASEILDHIGAGHETTGVALTYTTYHLSVSPRHQALLRDELNTLLRSSSIEGSLTFKQIDLLPFLNAVILETLRLNSPVPGSQPRITPVAGFTLGGHYIPGGVTISGQAWSLHRAFCPDPEVWRPERWLENDERDKEKGGKWLWVFGSGGRGCIGKWLATYEMKMTLATIYSNFETKIVDDSGIEIDDRYITGPLSNQLLVGFHKF